MSSALLEAALRRDRTIVAVSLATLTAIAWIYILWLAAAADMPEMGATASPDLTGVGLAMDPPSEGRIAFAVTFAMWSVMMVGMMTPSVAPMILLYSRVGRQAAERGTPLAATGFFAGGYLIAWMVFSLAATIAQQALDRAMLLTPTMAMASGALGGCVLIAAGIFQWTPIKDICIERCQAPLLFIQRHGGFRRDPGGALALGFRHGLYCVGCCWAVMSLLFVGGVMNIFWIAIIAIFILVEKLAVRGVWLSRFAGLLLVTSGGWLLLAAGT